MKLRAFNPLKHTSHRGRFKTYRSYLSHYLLRILKGRNSKDKIFFFLLNKEEQQKHFQSVINYYQAQQNKQIMDKYKPNQQEDGMSSYIMGKIMGAYKSTKESPYVKSLYQETSNVFGTDNQQSNSRTDGFANLPENTSITLYPSYSKHENGEYHTRVKGIITASSPTLSRKNRFLLSMARRITKSNDVNSIESTQFENEMRDAITHQDTYRSSNFNDDESVTSSSSAQMSSSDDTIKHRMEGIMAKIISNTPLNITIGSDEPVDDLMGANLTSDGFGIFQLSIVTPYKPSYVAVTSVIDPSILQTITVDIVKSRGVSVITDIDDTIRVTGVLAEKRELFRNIFTRPYNNCEVPGIAEWYQELYKDFNCAVHYVSNSPWQIYNIVHGFMSFMGFPITSVHLRQYSGNLVASFTQPSAERKRPSLVALFEEFPDRKFILVGDTGEQDLEAYLSLIPQFGDRILAIYLRVVPTSFSSLGRDEHALNEIQKLIGKRTVDGISSKKVNDFLKNPTGVDSDDSDDDVAITKGKSRRRSSLEVAKSTLNTAVAYSGVKKLAPIVPRKPESLRGSKLPNLEEMMPLPLPPRPQSQPPVGKSKTYFESNNECNDAPGVNDNNSLEVDKRLNIWKQRAERIMNEIPEHISFEFWTDVEYVRKDSIKLIMKELK